MLVQCTRLYGPRALDASNCSEGALDSSYFTQKSICAFIPGGGHLYFRLDIILVKGLSKYTLNTYFSGMKIDPKYVFLCGVFLICPLCPFQNLSIWPNDVRTYIAWSWKTTLITWIFFRGWYPTSNTSGPPGHLLTSKSCISPLPEAYRNQRWCNKQ